MKSKDTGRLGERLAAGYLSRNGYKILDSNYHYRGGEVDIIASKDGCLVFVEVKARRSAAFGTPQEAVTESKKRKLIETALTYRQEHEGLPDCWRIDVITVTFGKEGEPPRIELIENAVTED
jgi:putative endonuclease